MSQSTHSQEKARYTLATGAAAAQRLEIVHEIWGQGTREAALQSGLARGMKVADFGCGVGTVSTMLAELVGPEGRVTALDLSGEQIEMARARAGQAGFANVEFHEGNAMRTGLPDASFDLVHCRLLLLHLPDPMAALAEMKRVLRPGGILFVEDADMASGHSVPPSALDRFAELYPRLGRTRGLDYTLAGRLHLLVLQAGMVELSVRFNQPAYLTGRPRRGYELSLEEARPHLIEAGLITAGELDALLAEMRVAAEDPNLLVVTPRMTAVTARKPATTS